ncbi:tRNA pseudouridine(38-40) synthase TruA [Shimazuella sp. AN120528]|uniref:tRNA pseudouridine(38-40) synthase TruA n=1 Tax=Shimazuella soli TaxID=1892854 RepID=UPI001F115317|nr:tRNA pseudouridine(38-40) synthase TruA [Shimazuella soli]MCH5585970.1 tRNA pseudouridine(38-40) synthase TruA [Shimazuella soli]
MRKIKMIIAYDGTDFSGFQRQPGRRTIQGVLEETLSRILKENIIIEGSGRTDAGVHALGQVCHFITSKPIPAERFPYILRHSLPPDLIINSSEEVEMDFHARKSAHWKTYRYQVETQAVPRLHMRRFAYHYPVDVDLKAMKQAAEYLLGQHDFTSFCSAKTEIEDKVRTVYDAAVWEENGFRYIEVTGSGFLYNMVRIIVGTLHDVGKGKIKALDIPSIINACDRQAAGSTFPPEGLHLLKVGYQPIAKDFLYVE